ncbi:hypothetical protein [Paenibacillus soyae]|uniref:Sporulation protein n=1 Tax=Paenibacillus soyae TaxID=2969249 RepID=A0A9X2SC14_9BACL|nr:hypothetical protein [Paenibacillus soyae]MCR2807786.1 hypothetical protein [Paenibacillus soyae]
MSQTKGIRRGRRMWRMLWIGLFGTVLLAAGCGKEAGYNAKSYQNDGYLGYTNTNPNLLNRSGTLYDKDMELINQLIRPMKGIERAEAGFNGDELNVTLRVNGHATKQERKGIRAEAQSVLQSNFPRYDVHVKVTD